MAAIVSAELAEQAWQRIGALDERSALELQQRSGKFQPQLVGFVLGFTHELSPAAMGIALYAMLVLFEMFQRGATRIKKVQERAILRAWHVNRGLTRKLLAAEFERELMQDFVTQSTEPAALQYVIDALLDAQEESGDLPPDEVAHVLAVHKTIIDALHEAARL